MPRPDQLKSDYAALNDLIVNSTDFERLEALLGGFNLFQVLAFEYGEIRHSNVLAWILDPAGSHGLGATFLKKWLMRVIHEGAAHKTSPIAPIEIDGWRLLDIEVRREWRNLDLLVILNFVEGESWVIAIENKVTTTQHTGQLERYRTVVEREFSKARHRLYLFLTKDDESPVDKNYLPVSYSQVHRALKESLDAGTNAIGHEPKVLLVNYLRLLEEKFMNDSEIARTALRIYQQHRRALDVIFEHRPDNLRRLTDRIKALFTENADQLGIVVEVCTKTFIRILPREWDQPGNTHGNAWLGTNRTVMFEVNLTGKTPYLYVSAGKAPAPWIDPLWERAAVAPFNRPKRFKERPQTWCMLHLANQTKIDLAEETLTEPEQLAQRVFEWCAATYNAPETREVIRIIAEELPKLHDLSHQTTS